MTSNIILSLKTFVKNIEILILPDGTCMCGPNSACDLDRVCANATGVTYGNPNATFECSCSDVSHCPNTTDTCSMTTVPALCTCGDSPPCDAPSTCLNLTTFAGQPKCSCLDAVDCLDNADACDDSTIPPMCQCTANANSTVCEEKRICANLTELPGQPACSCLDALDCLDNADACDNSTFPPLCQCRANSNSMVCDEDRVCVNLTDFPGQPACSCLDAKDCLDNADACDPSTVLYGAPPLCLCTNNIFSMWCDDDRTCLNLTELPGQPACSCLDASDCLDNADACDNSTIPPLCQCTANANSTVCDQERICVNLTEHPGQPACSCLDAADCLANADTCNSTLSPPLCECAANTPSMSPCDAGRVCLNMTEFPSQPPCSCLDDTHCPANSDNCNTTSSMCQCDTKNACAVDSLCINNYTVTGDIGPQCTCLPNSTETGCPATANGCDDSTDPPSCKCNGKDPCGMDRACLNVEGQPDCSCLTDQDCVDLGTSDCCDLISSPPLCKCGNGTACKTGEECVGGECVVRILTFTLFYLLLPIFKYY